MEEWIDIRDRWPQEGETLLLPALKGKFVVHKTALYLSGRLTIPLGIVEKYKIDNN